MKKNPHIPYYVPYLFLFGILSCINQSEPEKKSQFGIEDATKIILQNEARWSETNKRYTYEYSYHYGIYSPTQSGTCEISETVVCKWYSGDGEEGESTQPGRIQPYFDSLKTITQNVSPDTIKRNGDFAFTLSQLVKVNDSLSLPYGYSVWFNSEFGYIDSLFIYPFGVQLRVRSLTLME
jgi:hypothetical protein